MQHFITRAGDVYAYDDDVTVETVDGMLRFTAAHGSLLDTPADLAPYTPPAPQPPSLDEVKAAKLAELAQACSLRMDAIKAGYPAEEVQSWDKQESEARAYTASSSAATPLLSALASARGITLADLAARVIAKADAFAAASGAIIGKRQRYEDQVTAATEAAAVEAIAWQD